MQDELDTISATVSNIETAKDEMLDDTVELLGALVNGDEDAREKLHTWMDLYAEGRQIKLNEDEEDDQ